MRFLVACSIVAIGTFVPGCGAGLPYDSSTDASLYDQRFDAVASDGNGDCLAPGTAQVQVALEIVPGLDVQRSDVWLAAMCRVGDEEHVVRVVAADPMGGPTALTGLGGGRYVIRASALVVPGSVSPQLTLQAGGTTLTTLTLQPGPSPLVVLRASFPDGGIDAGTPDGGGFDSGPMQVAVVSAPIPSPDHTTTIGTLEAYVQPRDANSFDVQLHVRASDCDGGCYGLMIDSAEIRSATGALPAGVAVTTFGSMAVPPGMSTVSLTRTLPGSLADPAGMHLAVALFPYVPPARDAGTDARDH